MASSLPQATTDNNRRQSSTTLQRIRRQSMTEEQRHEYLSRRRTNYQLRRYEIAPEDSSINVSNVAPNSRENATSRRREQQRILDRRRQNLMTNDERTTYFAQRREAYRRRNQHSLHVSREGNDDDAMVHQMSHVQPITYQSLTSNFERGSTSTWQQTTTNFQRQQPTNNYLEGQHLKLLMPFNVNKENDIQVVQEDDIAKYQQNQFWLNARLLMPVRTHIIGLGWKITIRMKTYDFGRVILRIFLKLKRHTAKRIGWIEG